MTNVSQDKYVCRIIVLEQMVMHILVTNTFKLGPLPALPAIAKRVAITLSRLTLSVSYNINMYVQHSTVKEREANVAHGLRLRAC